jgi:hypothetical protein
MSRGSLSSRRSANCECLRWSPSVRSRNSICATSSGRTQTHFFIFSAVNASPHRALWVSGRFTNGHSGVTSGRSFSKTLRRDAGTNPFRMRATYFNSSPVVANDAGVQAVWAWCEAADYELLAEIDSVLGPGSAALSGFVDAVLPFTEASTYSTILTRESSNLIRDRSMSRLFRSGRRVRSRLS